MMMMMMMILITIMVGMKIVETRINGPVNFLFYCFITNCNLLRSNDGILLVEALDVDQ